MQPPIDPRRPNIQREHPWQNVTFHLIEGFELAEDGVPIGPIKPPGQKNATVIAREFLVTGAATVDFAQLVPRLEQAHAVQHAKLRFKTFAFERGRYFDSWAFDEKTQTSKFYSPKGTARVDFRLEPESAPGVPHCILSRVYFPPVNGLMRVLSARRDGNMNDHYLLGLNMTLWMLESELFPERFRGLPPPPG